MRLITACLLLLATGVTSVRAEIISAYTEIDIEKGCSVFEMNTEGGEFANFACNGYKGYPVLIYSGDLRESLFYGYPPEADHVFESFGGFNSTGKTIEWRIEKSSDIEKPFAVIHRWFVSADGENPEKQTEVLVIEKVGQIDARDGCTVGLVLASGNPKANETARKIADEQAADFACGVDERVLVGGEPGSDIPMPGFTSGYE